MTDAFHFDTETAVEQIADGRWRGQIAGDWNIGDNPNGGYLLSVAVQALAATLPHPDPVTTTTHFLRPGVADAPCDIEVEVIRSGRTLSTARATFSEGVSFTSDLARQTTEFGGASSSLEVREGAEEESRMQTSRNCSRNLPMKKQSMSKF